MLVLPIKKKWFDMIVSGEKKEEYREIKPYYDRRFIDYLSIPCVIDRTTVHMANPKFDVIFRNGYKYNSPSVKCRCVVSTGIGKKEWGATPGQQYYVLKILNILEVRNNDN